MRAAFILLAAALVVPATANAQNMTLEISEEHLNGFIAVYRLSVLAERGSDSPRCLLELPTLFETCYPVGVFECPPGPQDPLVPSRPSIPMLVCERVGGGQALVPAGPPVPWKYSISSSAFTISENGMLFRATVETEVNSVSGAQDLRSQARVFFDQQAQRLRVMVDPLYLTLRSEDCQVAVIDLAPKFTFAIPLDPAPISLQLPAGGVRYLNVGVNSVTPRYRQGWLELDLDMDFQ